MYTVNTNFFVGRGIMDRENLFSIDFDDSESVIDHDEFIVKRESAALSAERRALDEKFHKQMRTSIKSFAFYSMISAIAMIVGIGLWFMVAIEYSGTKTFLALPAAIGIACFAVAAVLIILRRASEKKQNESDDKEIDEVGCEYGRLNAITRADLGVPEDSPEIEIFCYTHGAKNDDEDKKRPHMLDTATVFCEGDSLGFFYGTVVILIPKSDIESIVRVNKAIEFDMWGKDEPYDSGEYAQYGIVKKEDKVYDESFTVSYYYSLRFNRDGNAFEVKIPPYEISHVTSLVGIEPVDE